MPSAKEIAFHQAMLHLYERALKETGYAATRFREMVTSSGGISAARTLLDKPEVPVGFTEMVLRNRMDLTMEAMILDSDEWLEMFEEHELRVAFERLDKVGYVPKYKLGSKK